MKPGTRQRALALVAAEPCPLCADKGAALLTQLAGLPVLGVVQCPACTADQPARVLPMREDRPRGAA